KLKKSHKRAIASSGIYKVRRGDNLSVIAKRFKLSVSELKQTNGLRSSRIYVGQRLRVPSGESSTARSVSSVTEHRVSRGENLSTIASRYGTSVSTIRKLNRMRGSRIFPGQKLRLPANQVTTYRVRSGDNLTKIAQRFGVSVDTIRRSNGLSNSVIYPNQKLMIPSDS